MTCVKFTTWSFYGTHLWFCLWIDTLSAVIRELIPGWCYISTCVLAIWLRMPWLSGTSHHLSYPLKLPRPKDDAVWSWLSECEYPLLWSEQNAIDSMTLTYSSWTYLVLCTEYTRYICSAFISCLQLTIINWISGDTKQCDAPVIEAISCDFSFYRKL